MSPMGDRQVFDRMSAVVTKAKRTRDPVERARYAIELEQLAGLAVADSIQQAHRAGHTWREIGAEVGTPFQTLYKRYRRNESVQKEGK